MSKETFIGGNLTEEIGGSYKIYVREGYEVTSLHEVVYNADEKIKHGINEQAPFAEFNTGIDLYIEFEPLPTYDGEFGFDWLKVDNSDAPLKVQTDDIANLEFVYDSSKQEYSSVSATPNLKNEIKKEYKQFPLKVPYYIPWLNLMQIGQEIKLNMICKPIDSGEDITKEEVSFGKNEFYEVIIDGQKNENIKYTPDGNPKEITIKCIKPSKDIGIIAVDKNGKEIGKIAAIDNTKTFELPVRLICVVKDTVNKETEIAQLISDFKSEKIEDYLNKNSLNQALIKTTVEIDSKYRIAFDETAWSGTFYDKTNNWFTNRKNSDGSKVKYIDDNGEEIEHIYEHILDKFLRDYKTAFEADGKEFKGILLFITNIDKDKNDNEGGVSRTKPVNFREAIVFGSNLKDKSSYSHEIAHALGLEHYFWRDAEYKKSLDELKQNIKSNEDAIIKNNENIKICNNNIKIFKENEKIYAGNMKIFQNNIKEYESYQKTHPNYYKENPKVASFVKEQKEKIRKAQEDIQNTPENIKKEETKISEYVKANENIEKLLIKQKNNLNVYKENKIKFKEKSTLNIMDYSSTVNLFTNWQWKIMQNDVKSYYGTITENK
ncbi:M43 family zinc metalloprotease [Chryseobacterium indoltheticum]|uniref:M43 family zinc metalloprotease n=1 Tax=Chryseobacterium indoltheticum TaxID=254 RepID=UPI003F49445A